MSKNPFSPLRKEYTINPVRSVFSSTKKRKLWKCNNLTIFQYNHPERGMGSKSFLVCILIALVVAMAAYYVRGHTMDHYQGELCESDLLDRSIPTSPEVEYIQGQPDMHVVNHDGIEIIPPGDIALSPGFGIGEGLVGFGRYGNSMMA